MPALVTDKNIARPFFQLNPRRCLFGICHITSTYPCEITLWFDVIVITTNDAAARGAVMPGLFWSQPDWSSGTDYSTRCLSVLLWSSVSRRDARAFGSGSQLSIGNYWRLKVPDRYLGTEVQLDVYSNSPSTIVTATSNHKNYSDPLHHNIHMNVGSRLRFRFGYNPSSYTWSTSVNIHHPSLTVYLLTVSTYLGLSYFLLTRT